MKAICTVCSRKKRSDEGLLSARLRYEGEHILEVDEIAKKADAPYFILSGKFGLLAADEEIADYDYYLEESAIEALAEKVATQLKDADITEIDLYTKEKWLPYNAVMQKAVAIAGVPMTTYHSIS